VPPRVPGQYHERMTSWTFHRDPGAVGVDNFAVPDRCRDSVAGCSRPHDDHITRALPCAAGFGLQVFDVEPTEDHAIAQRQQVALESRRHAYSGRGAGFESRGQSFVDPHDALAIDNCAVRHDQGVVDSIVSA
jgi:hypothetical protein